MSRMYCPQCGEETAEYKQQAVVKTLPEDAGEQFSAEMFGEYEVHKCLCCGACFTFMGMQKEGIK